MIVFHPTIPFLLSSPLLSPLRSSSHFARTFPHSTFPLPTHYPLYPPSFLFHSLVPLLPYSAQPPSPTTLPPSLSPFLVSPPPYPLPPLLPLPTHFYFPFPPPLSGSSSSPVPLPLYPHSQVPPNPLSPIPSLSPPRSSSRSGLLPHFSLFFFVLTPSFSSFP